MILIRTQRGFNLIELMIVGLLTILSGYFMIQIMMNSNQSASSSDGVSQAQETARLALSWLHQDIRRAGFSANLQEPRTQPFADLCTNGNAPPNDMGNCTFESNVPGDTSNDRIAIRRTFSPASNDPRDSTDCSGADLTGLAGLVPEESILTDVYWVEAHMTNTGYDDPYDDVLKCTTYNDDTSQAIRTAALASGIEGMQVMYASSSAGFGSVTHYQPASSSLDMENVYAVRISVLARSFSVSALDESTRSYILLDAMPYTFEDKTPRQILTTTIALKNYSEPDP